MPRRGPARSLLASRALACGLLACGLLACGLLACNKDNPLFGLELTVGGELDTGEVTRTSGDGETTGATAQIDVTGETVATSDDTTAGTVVETTDATTGPVSTCPMGHTPLGIGFAERVDGDLVPRDIGECGVGLNGVNGSHFQVKSRAARTLEIESCTSCGQCGGGAVFELTLDFANAEEFLAPLDDQCLWIVLAPGYVLDAEKNLCGFSSAILRVVEGEEQGTPVPHVLAHRSPALDATFDQFGFNMRHDATHELPECADAPECPELGPAAARQTKFEAWTGEDPQHTPLAALRPGEIAHGATFTDPAGTYDVTVHLVRAEVDPDCERVAVEWVAAFDPV